jgi:hypothetical protein
MGKIDPRSIRIEIKTSHEELSEMIGTMRSRIAFFIHRFRNLGVIETNSDHFLIIKESKLTDYLAQIASSSCTEPPTTAGVPLKSFSRLQIKKTSTCFYASFSMLTFCAMASEVSRVRTPEVLACRSPKSSPSFWSKDSTIVPGFLSMFIMTHQ